MPASADGLRTGLLFGLVAYTWWGLIPVYFRLLKGIEPLEILSHRIVWAVALLAVVVPLAGKWPDFRAAVASRRLVATLVVSAALLSVNWLLYVTATVTDRVVDASLGYYMLPLVNAFLATVFLREKLRPAHYPALALVAVAVAVPSVALGRVPWIAVGLSVSFGFYGLVRKVAKVESLVGLAVETLVILPATAGYLLWTGAAGGLKYGQDTTQTLLLSCGGVVTVVPLLTFTLAIRRLPLLALNLIQVLSPTMQFLLAVVWFGEAVPTPMWVALGCVWVAVAVFITDAAVQARAGRPVVETDADAGTPSVAEVGR